MRNLPAIRKSRNRPGVPRLPVILFYVTRDNAAWMVTGPGVSERHATLVSATIDGVAIARAAASDGTHVELLSRRPDGAWHVVWSSLEESG